MEKDIEHTVRDLKDGVGVEQKEIRNLQQKLLLTKALLEKEKGKLGGVNDE